MRGAPNGESRTMAYSRSKICSQLDTVLWLTWRSSRKARLGILTCLVTRSAGLVFNELKRQCSLTDGNLSRHLTILSDAGLVEQWKGQGAGRPQTLCRLTDSGRTRFLDYLSELERVIRDAVPEPRTSAAGSGTAGFRRERTFASWATSSRTRMPGRI